MNSMSCMWHEKQLLQLKQNNPCVIVRHKFLQALPPQLTPVIALQKESFLIFNYETYCRSKENAISRVCGSITTREVLFNLYKGLCDQSVTRMLQIIQIRNLLFSVESIKRTVKNCRICTELKSRFYKPDTRMVIKRHTCFTCGKLGHKSIDCLSKNRNFPSNNFPS